MLEVSAKVENFFAVPDHAKGIRSDILAGRQWLAANRDARFDGIDPATGPRIVCVADGAPADALKCVGTAAAAAGACAAATPRGRADVLMRSYKLKKTRAAGLRSLSLRG